MILSWARKNYLYLVFFLSFAATVGSLFISEFIGLLPCDLCWFQRGMMYPIALISFVAILLKDKNVYRYILPLASIGWILAFYQYLLQKTDWFENINFCSVSNPCGQQQINLLGFITIPFMSLVTFTLIIALCYLYWKRPTR